MLVYIPYMDPMGNSKTSPALLIDQPMLQAMQSSSALILEAKSCWARKI